MDAKSPTVNLTQSADEFARLVAGRICERRAELGMSKLSVAIAAGLDQRAITFVERGSRVPLIVTLYRIAYALNTTAEKLVKTENTHR